MSKLLLRLVQLAVIALAGWWLFGDTYARYAGHPNDEHTIRFAHFGGAGDLTFWCDVISEFELQNPSLTVRQEYVVGLSGLYNTKMRQQILSGTLPDVAVVQLGPFHELAGAFRDLADLRDSSGQTIAAQLDALAVGAFQHKGVQRGLPISGGNLLIYCNVDCFDRASEHLGRTVSLPGDDWTMADFMETARALTQDFDGDGVIDQFGFWHPRWVYFLPFLWSFGADVVDVDREVWLLEGHEAEAAIEFHRALLRGDRVSPHDDEVPQLFQDVAFLSGKVAMCVNGPWFMPFLGDTKLADRFVVAHIPMGPDGRATRVTWDGVVMRRDLSAGKREAAERFIGFVLSEWVQERLARSGRALPARVDSMKRFVNPPGDVRRQRFVDALEYSRLQPLMPGFSEVDRAINRHLDRLYRRGSSPSVAEVLDELAADPAVASRFERGPP